MLLKLLRRFAGTTTATPSTTPSRVVTKESALKQSPNYATTWSTSQTPRSVAMSCPRFEQVPLDKQPQPFAAIDLIARQPVIRIEGRKACCDGGGGPLGHPKVFLNLDQHGEAATCKYCGLRYQQAATEHH
jgi:NADH dehydrogenase (ubiquinone) Fe-S protein 6